MEPKHIRNIAMTVALVLIVCAFYAFETHINRQRPLSAVQKTINTLRYCEWLESGNAYLNSNQVVAYLHSNEASGLSLGQIFEGMRLYPQCIPQNIVGNTNIASVTNLSGVKDGWGNPVVFMWRSALTSATVSPGLMSKRFPVIIWSTGPNGSNEFGFGDDLFTTYTNSVE
jgi:hypothetical protein